MERNSYTRLTLALDIVGRIVTGELKGYHELSTIKHQIDLHDTLILEPSSRLSIECDDPRVPGDETNICIRAVKLLQKEYSIDQPVRITLMKRIPVMGGLAGGSTNAATMLSMLSDMWDLRLPAARLMELGRRLGMDVPFYFNGKTAFDTETTGRCEPLPTDIAMTFVLALADFGVSTAQAYSAINYDLIGRERELTERMKHYFVEHDAKGVVSCIHNDFERSVFVTHPRLAQIKQALLDAGCTAAALSGSGSTVFGVAADVADARQICSKMDCRTIIVSTLKGEANG